MKKSTTYITLGSIVLSLSVSSLACKTKPPEQTYEEYMHNMNIKRILGGIKTLKDEYEGYLTHPDPPVTYEQCNEALKRLSELEKELKKEDADLPGIRIEINELTPEKQDNKLPP